MKIAVTVTKCYQVGMDDLRDSYITKVFNDTDTKKSMLEWANTIIKEAMFSDLKMSEVVE